MQIVKLVSTGQVRLKQYQHLPVYEMHVQFVFVKVDLSVLSVLTLNCDKCRQLSECARYKTLPSWER